jgi:hypothetical protein
MKSETKDGMLNSIIKFSLLALAVFTAGGWLLYDWNIAQSIIAGGILANGSFYLLKRDLEQVIARVSVAGGSFRRVKNMEKIRFFIKFYARLIVLGLLLFVLATKVHINMIGLVIGLSTVMLSVVVVALSKNRLTYSVQA